MKTSQTPNLFDLMRVTNVTTLSRLDRTITYLIQ